MKIIRVPKAMFYDRCKERNINPAEAQGCIYEEQENGLVAIDIEHPDYPRPTKKSKNIAMKRLSEIHKFPHSTSDVNTIKGGVGSELKKLLSYININSSPNCACNARASTMDEKGIQWCKDNKDTIIDWLEEEAKKRRLPFIRYGAKKILDLAIYRAEKKQKKK